MRQYIRKKVIEFKTHPNDSPDESNRQLWPVWSEAVLECGHTIGLGAGSSYRPKRMACVKCGPRNG